MQQKRYALACPTSMGVRITPADRQGVHTSSLYQMQATSAETNVLNIAASLGHACLALTKFVEGSPIAQYIQAELRRRNIRYEGVSVPQAGPWGYRHQFNIADSGFGLRGPRVWNDRAGEVGRILSLEEFDLPRIFGSEGVAILHISGLIAALSPSSGEFCVALAAAAKEHGTLVSFDLNYRASFWEGREAELSRIFHELASHSDILIGNEVHFRLTLGLSGADAATESYATTPETMKPVIKELLQKYPQVGYCASTLRETISANEHNWGALLYAQGEWCFEPLRVIPVLDRIGGGDAFSGGLLYGIFRGWEPEKCLQFGWACGALAVTELADYASPADEEQVWDVYRGNAQVRR